MILGGDVMKKVICLIFIFAVLLSLNPLTVAGYSSADVVSGGLVFDGIDVMSDLEDATVNDKVFDVANYPYIENARPQFILFAEYAYTFKKSLQGNYGLYLYIYNPSGLEIGSYSNSVQMSVAFEGDNVDLWEKFDLALCSVSVGEYSNLFYKFRIVDHVSDVDGKTILERVNSVKRVYAISGIELFYVGAINAIDYKVGGRYVFTGYAKGYGISVYDENTLLFSYSEFDAIELDVRGTFYRTPSSDKGKGYKYQLNSVYFAFEDRYEEEYGALSRILATAYEYTTKNMVVTQSSVVYDRFIEYIGEYFSGYNSDIDRSLYLDYVNFDYRYWTWALNPYAVLDYDSWGMSIYNIERVLYYLFYVNNVRSDTVSGETLGKWIYDYYERFGGGSGETLPIKDGTISADLFQAVDGDDGKRTYDIDAADAFNLLVYDGDWFNTLSMYGLADWIDWMSGKIDFGKDNKDITPFYKIKSSDFYGSIADISARLLVAESEVPALIEYYDAVKLKTPDKSVYLFRFSVTDYYAEDLVIYSENNWPFNSHWPDQAYLARETVYFDFGIIQLTFTRNGTDSTVIPVVGSPIDIFADIETPLYAEPVNNFSWLVLVVLAVVVIGGIVVLVWLK
jgi:hypothetical protein